MWLGKGAWALDTHSPWPERVLRHLPTAWWWVFENYPQFLPKVIKQNPRSAQRSHQMAEAEIKGQGSWGGLEVQSTAPERGDLLSKELQESAEDVLESAPEKSPTYTRGGNAQGRKEKAHWQPATGQFSDFTPWPMTFKFWATEVERPYWRLSSFSTDARRVSPKEQS